MDVPYFVHSRELPGAPSVSSASIHEGNPPIRRSSCHGGSISSGFGAEPSTAMMSHRGNAGGQGHIGAGEPARRKRGRPRKYGPDGSASSPMAMVPVPESISGAGSLLGSEGPNPMPKRLRGRPIRTGKKPHLVSSGGQLSGSVGAGFTPHVIRVELGEDIMAKLMSFIEGPRFVCILTANGVVSQANLQHGTTGGTVALFTYEGPLEILSLSEICMLANGGLQSGARGLTISLSNSEGNVIGGDVSGKLIAASPI